MQDNFADCFGRQIPLGDEISTIFISTKGQNPENISEELREFLAYLENSTDRLVAEGKTTGVKLLHEKVKQKVSLLYCLQNSRFRQKCVKKFRVRKMYLCLMSG